MMRYKRCLATALVGLAVLTAAGCGKAKPKPEEPASVTDGAKPPTGGTQPSGTVTNPPTAPSTGGPGGTTATRQNVMEQTVVLPDGKTLTLSNPGPVAVGDMQVRLDVLGVANDAPDAVGNVLGNHVENAVSEQVTLPSGKAVLAVATRGEPAASGSDKQTTEIWLMAFRKHPDRLDMQVAYCIIGVVTGDEAKAKQTMLQLGQNWTLPPQ